MRTGVSCPEVVYDHENMLVPRSTPAAHLREDCQLTHCAAPPVRDRGCCFELLKPAAEGGEPPGVPGRGHQLPASPFE